MPTLIIEDGTCPTGSNTYASLADADAYLVPRGLWPVTPDVAGETGGDPASPDPVMVAAKEAALLRACDYLNTLQWRGQPVDWQRTMAWPRMDVPQPGGSKGAVLPDNVVPKAVAQAQIELAALVYSGTNPLAQVERGGKVASESVSESKSVDVISKSESHSVTYADSAPIETYFPAVSGLVAVFLSVVPGKSGARMVEVGRG